MASWNGSAMASLHASFSLAFKFISGKFQALFLLMLHIGRSFPELPFCSHFIPQGLSSVRCWPRGAQGPHPSLQARLSSDALQGPGEPRDLRAGTALRHKGSRQGMPVLPGPTAGPVQGLLGDASEIERLGLWGAGMVRVHSLPCLPSTRIFPFRSVLYYVLYEKVSMARKPCFLHQ